MADQITANPNAPRDWAGDIVPGALLYTYATGTTTPVTVYQDVAATIPHPNPIAADGNGVFPQMFYTGVVKCVVTDPGGVVLPGFPLDPMPRSVVGTSGASVISFLPTPEIPETNVQDAIEHVDRAFGAFGQVLRAADTAATARASLELGAAALLGVSGSGDFTEDPASVANRGTTKAVIDATIPATLNASGAAPMYAARAWVNFFGVVTPAIYGAGNVASVSYLGVGSYQINFTTAMPDTNYAVSLARSGNGFIRVVSKAVGSVTILTTIANSGGDIGGVAEDVSDISVVVHR